MLLSSFLAVKESAKVGEIRAMYVTASNSKYVPKFWAHILKFPDNFRDSCPSELFSSGINSQSHEDNFQMNITRIMEIYTGEK